MGRPNNTTYQTDSFLTNNKVQTIYCGLLLLSGRLFSGIVTVRIIERSVSSAPLSLVFQKKKKKIKKI
jgi:hypothetical protein